MHPVFFNVQQAEVFSCPDRPAVQASSLSACAGIDLKPSPRELTQRLIIPPVLYPSVHKVYLGKLRCYIINRRALGLRKFLPFTREELK